MLSEDDDDLASMPIAMAYALVVLTYSLGGEQSHQTLTHACQEQLTCDDDEREFLVRNQRIPVCQQLLQNHGPRSGHWVGWPYIHDSSTVAHCRRCACTNPADWQAKSLACFLARADTRAVVNELKPNFSDFTKIKFAGMHDPGAWIDTFKDTVLSKVKKTTWRATAADNMLLFVILCVCLLPFTRKSTMCMNVLPIVLSLTAIGLLTWKVNDVKAYVDTPLITGVIDHVTDSAALYAVTTAFVMGLKTRGWPSVELHLHPFSWSAETIVSVLWLFTLLVYRSCETLERSLGSGLIQFLTNKTSEAYDAFVRTLQFSSATTPVVIEPSETFISHLTTAYHARLLDHANGSPEHYGGSSQTGPLVKRGSISLRFFDDRPVDRLVLQAPAVCYRRRPLLGPLPQGAKQELHREELDWALQLVGVYDLERVIDDDHEGSIAPQTPLLVFRPIAKSDPDGVSAPPDRTSHLPQNWKSIVLPSTKGSYSYTLSNVSVLIPKEGGGNHMYYNPRRMREVHLNTSKIDVRGTSFDQLVYVEAPSVAGPWIASGVLQEDAIKMQVVYSDLEAEIATTAPVVRSKVVDCAVCVAIDSAKKQSDQRTNMTGVKSKLQLPNGRNCRQVMQLAEAAYDDGHTYVPADEQVPFD